MSRLLTLSDSVAAHARTRPGKLAVRDSRRSLTYAQWDERASRLANALLGLGLAKGDRVALLAYNAIEWLEIYVALARAGLVAVPINFRLVGREIALHRGAQRGPRLHRPGRLVRHRGRRPRLARHRCVALRRVRRRGAPTAGAATRR